MPPVSLLKVIKMEWKSWLSAVLFMPIILWAGRTHSIPHKTFTFSHEADFFIQSNLQKKNNHIFVKIRIRLCFSKNHTLYNFMFMFISFALEKKMKQIVITSPHWPGKAQLYKLYNRTFGKLEHALGRINKIIYALMNRNGSFLPDFDESWRRFQTGCQTA